MPVPDIVAAVVIRKGKKRRGVTVCALFAGSIYDMDGFGIKEKTMNLKGSYTIEASLLMGIILPVLAGLIYIGFWYHDKSFLQSAAYEAACAASLKEDEESFRIGEAAMELTKGRMLGTGNLQVQSKDGEEKASVSYYGNFRKSRDERNLFSVRGETFQKNTKNKRYRKNSKTGWGWK